MRAVVFLMATGLWGGFEPAGAEESPRLTIEPAADSGRVEIVWPSRPDHIHTLLATEGPEAAELVDARLVPDGPGEVTRTEVAVQPEAAARFFRLRTRAMVPVVMDDFDRAEEGPQPPGIPPLGNPWTVIGLGGALPGRHAVVEKGDCYVDLVGLGGVTYLCQELTAPPCLLEADFRWEPYPDTGLEGTLVIACGPGNQPNWIYRLVHVRIIRTAVLLDFMDSGVLTNHMTLEIPQLALQQTHNCRVYIDPEAQAVLVVLNDQPVLGYRHEAVARLGGRFVFWEHDYNRGGGEARLHIERVLAAVP